MTDDETRDFTRQLFGSRAEPAPPKSPIEPDAEMRAYANALFHNDTEEN